MILGLLGVGYHREAPAVVPKSTVFTFLFAPELKTGCSNGRCSLFRKGEWRSNTAVLRGAEGIFWLWEKSHLSGILGVGGSAFLERRRN